MQAKNTENLSSLEDFSFRLRAALERKGLSQVAFAREIGVNESRVNQWVTARNRPKQELYRSIANVLGCDPQWLMFGPHEKSRESNYPDENLRESNPSSIPKGTDLEGGIAGGKRLDSHVVTMREDYMPKVGEKKGLLTRGELEDYVIRYLDYAQKHEGGMAIAQATILKHLTIDIFEHLPEK